MINFNDPIELTEIFRISTPIVKDKEQDPLHFEKDDEDFISTLTSTEFKTEEYSMKTAVLWEDIKSLRQYCYNDNDWKHLKGEKYYVNVISCEREILVLGSYKSMFEHWKLFRNEYPMYKTDID
jgi:hypothetical protein